MRLPPETAVNNTGQAAARLRFAAPTRQADPPSFHFGATGLAALLPALLDRAFRGEL